MRACKVWLLLLFLELGWTLTRPLSGSLTRTGRATDGGRPEEALLPLSISLEGPLRGEMPCYGGPSAGLSSTGLQLDYRSNATDYQWLQIHADISLNASLEEEVAASLLSRGCVEFRLTQEEHGGAGCNCWQVTSVWLNMTQLLDGPISARCNGSASAPRSVMWLTGSPDSSSCDDAPIMSELLVQPFSTNCSVLKPHINVSFELDLDIADCNVVNAYDEGVELAVQLDDDEAWIPIAFFYLTPSDLNSDVPVGDRTDDGVVIRGYHVTDKEEMENSPSNFTLCVCGLTGSVQFRWLQTSRFRGNGQELRDIWKLDNVEISYQDESGRRTVLLEDSFDTGQLNTSRWPEEGIRNGAVATESDLNCSTSSDPALIFGLNSRTITDRVVTSRSVKTVPLITQSFVTPNSPETTLGLPTTDPSTPPSQALKSTIEFVEDQISRNPDLAAIQSAEPVEAAVLLQNITLQDRTEDTVILYLLGDILDRFNSTNSTEQTLITKAFLCTSASLVGRSETGQGQVDVAILGASFLNVLDRLALEVFPTEGNASTGNINLLARLLSRNESLSVNTEDFPVSGDVPKLSIEIPLELAQPFADDPGVVRAVSFLLYNISVLFPGGENDTELGSGIVSTALQCGAEKCPTQDIPVTITIHHSTQTQRKLKANRNVKCVFWEFRESNSLLSTGQWSDRGCSRNEDLSNYSVTVCECTHLTHFAILLSAAPLNTSHAVTLSLQVIGYVGVSVSLVAMALTIATFLFLEYVNHNSSGSKRKPLLTIRNFVHINLCISLGIAQIIFVAAVDKTSGSDDDVPAHCKAVAVLLHYFLLVAFMWMLMEGVVLYVALVKVFVERKRLYMLGFAVSSYGLPLLYMGLVLPLGFGLDMSKLYYGYDMACFLNPKNHFIWAFIAPVIVIFLINCGFYVMAITIMCKQQKRLKKTSFRKWLKASVSLVVIMGLTWIFGVLIVEVEQLLPLAYIYTILVAFQGLFIFVIFVLLSKQVREAFCKWWRAKVKESETLSKYFGDLSFSSRINGAVDGFRYSNHGKQTLELKDEHSEN